MTDKEDLLNSPCEFHDKIIYLSKVVSSISDAFYAHSEENKRQFKEIKYCIKRIEKIIIFVVLVISFFHVIVPIFEISKFIHHL